MSLHLADRVEELPADAALVQVLLGVHRLDMLALRTGSQVA